MNKKDSKRKEADQEQINQLDEKVSNPHDSFFKTVMDQKKVAIDFFTNYLPANILKLIDIHTLEIKKDSFVEKELKKFYSDILYGVSCKKGKAYLYLLFEHQSTVDKLTAFRLLRYIVKIWELNLNQHPALKTLPPIIPLVLYHGKKKWNVGERLSDIISGDKEKLSLYLPDFTYLLYDFSPYSDRKIKGNIMVRVCLHLFRHIFDEDLPNHLKEIFPLLRELLTEDRTALEFIELALRYIVNASNAVRVEELIKLLNETVSKETGGIVMSLASRLKEEGKEEGELIGDIRFTQLMKGLPISNKKELEKLSIDDLKKKLEEINSLKS